MAVESIGVLVPTKIPGLSDSADIQAAFRAYHYGSYAFDTTETNPENLINPSIAYTINDLQDQIDNIDTSGTLLETDFAAKGDLLSASANDTLSVLSLGSNGTVLTANSATANGLEWASPSVTPTNTVTLENKTLVNSKITLSTNEETSSYTAILSDAGKVVEMNSASANNFTIPPNSSVAFDVGSQIVVLQTGTGQTTIVAGSGVTVNSSPGLKIRTQWTAATLIKRATNSWVAIGDLVS